MSKLKPIGSEKLQGDEKLKRIMEIARYKEVVPNSINETSSVDYQVKLADGNTYEIAKEKSGYVIKKRIDESHSEYIEPMKNRKHYSSYSSAFKRLNLIAKEVNTLTETTEGISLFTEQKKYTLKTPKPEVTEPEAPSMPPAPETSPAPEPVGGPSEPETSLSDMGVDMGPDAPEDPSMDSAEPSDDMSMDNEEDEVTFKSIQKLTGKLAQKIRDLQDQEEEISSKDAKYVINSIISAISDNLEEEDKEDIIGKLEGEDEESDFDMGGEDMGDEMPSEEMPMDDEESLPQPEGEMGEQYNEMGEDWNEGEVKEEDFLGKVFGNIFSESKVDKILKNYFSVNENEKKFITEKKQIKKQIIENKVRTSVVEINRLSESLNQRKVAKDILKNFPEITFVGKTNKGNLVFENKNKQLKVSPSGQIL